MRWRLFIYRVPSEPTRHRVGLWREFVKVGALSLQQAVWMLPLGSTAKRLTPRISDLVERADGQFFYFDISPKSADQLRLEDLYTEQREAAWLEFVVECDKFISDIENEFVKEKVTLADLDEEQQTLERLNRRYEELADRDHFGAASAPRAEQRLKQAAESLERFAEVVYGVGAEFPP